MSNRDRFQGVCLLGADGYMYMDTYDRFPPDVRLRLQSSTYNLCVECIRDKRLTSSRRDYHQVIDSMEDMLRRQEGNIYG